MDRVEGYSRERGDGEDGSEAGGEGEQGESQWTLSQSTIKSANRAVRRE